MQAVTPVDDRPSRVAGDPAQVTGPFLPIGQDDPRDGEDEEKNVVEGHSGSTP